MAFVVLTRSEAERGHLPEVCMCCGAPASSVVSKSFTWHPSWLLLLLFVGLLPCLIVYLLVKKQMRVEAPFCEEHKNHWKWRGRVHLGFAVLGFLLFFGGLATAMAQKPLNELGGWLLLGLLPLLLIWLVTAIILQSGAISATEITDGTITLKGVSAEFVDAVSRQELPTEYLRGARDVTNQGSSCVVMVFLAVFVMIVLIAAISSLGKPQPGGVVNEPTPPPAPVPPIVDQENRFKLVSPGRGWTLLPTAVIRLKNPIVFAAAEHESKIVGLVLIEPDDGSLDFDNESEKIGRALIADSTKFQNKKTERVQGIVFQGENAVQYQFTGTRDGETCRVENTVFAHEAKVYQLYVEGPIATTAADGSNFRPFVNAFSLLQHEGETRKAPTPASK